MIDGTENKEILKKIVFPYLDHIVVAKARRPLFYVSKDFIGRGNRQVPRTYLEKYKFNKEGILVDKDNNPILANPRVAGKPRIWRINFQSIWNQTLTKQARASYVLKIKNFLKEHLPNIDPIRKDDYPIKVYIELWDIKHEIDCSNRGAMFIKIIEDFLVTEGILENDKEEFVRANEFKLVDVEDEKDRRLIVYLLKENNEPKFKS